MITEQQSKEAHEIVKLYQLQQEHQQRLKFIPKIEPDMILEYRDLLGDWYEYTENIQKNIYFVPRALRVRSVKKEEK